MLPGADEHVRLLQRLLFHRAPPQPPVPEWLTDSAHRLKTYYSDVRTTAEFQAVIAQLAALGSRPFEVFVVGEGNFGKSTLLNALLGAELSAVHFLPETRAFLRYVATDSPSADARVWARVRGAAHAWLHPHLGAGRPSEEIFQTTEHRLPIEQAEALLKEEALRARRSSDYTPAIVEFERQVRPGPACPFPSAVRVVDTQGLNQIFPDELQQVVGTDAGTSKARFAQWMASNPRGKHLDWQLRRCDVLLWLAHARKAGAAVTAAALEHFRIYGKQTILAVTHIDQVRGGSQGIEAALARIEETHRDHVTAICPVNGKLALKGALTQDEDAIHASGLSRLSAELHRAAVGDANLTAARGAYVSLRLTERQLRGALVQLVDDLRGVEALFADHRRQILKAHNRAALTVRSALQHSTEEVFESARRRLDWITLKENRVAVLNRLNPQGLSAEHHNRAVQAMEEVREEAEQLVHEIKTQPYHLPGFDAEGRRSGYSVTAEVAVRLAIPETTPLRFSLRLDGTLFTRIGIGVLKLIGIVSAEKRRQAEEMERQALVRRRRDILGQFKQQWRGFDDHLRTQLTSAAQAPFHQLGASVDAAQRALEEHEGRTLGQTRLAVRERLARIAVPPALIANLNRLLSRKRTRRPAL